MLTDGAFGDALQREPTAPTNRRPQTSVREQPEHAVRQGDGVTGRVEQARDLVIDVLSRASPIRAHDRDPERPALEHHVSQRFERSRVDHDIDVPKHVCGSRYEPVEDDAVLERASLRVQPRDIFVVNRAVAPAYEVQSDVEPPGEQAFEGINREVRRAKRIEAPDDRER
jgi:hypothetical protein